MGTRGIGTGGHGYAGHGYGGVDRKDMYVCMGMATVLD